MLFCPRETEVGGRERVGDVSLLTRGSMQKRSRVLDPATPFTFLPQAAPESAVAAASPLPPPLPLTSSPGRDAILTAALEPTFGGPPVPFSLPARSIVTIDWSTGSSVGGYVNITTSDGRRGRVPATLLRLLPTAADAALGSGSWLQGDFACADAEQIDLTLGRGHHPPPLVVEPGLDALVFPVRPADFVARFLGARAVRARRRGAAQRAFRGAALV